MQGLRLVLRHYDLTGEVSPLAQTILRLLALNRLQDLVDWVSQADKMSVARLAPALFESAAHGSAEAAEILKSGAGDPRGILARAVARRLGRPDLRMVLFGGLFAHHPEYAGLFRQHLFELGSPAPVQSLARLRRARRRLAGRARLARRAAAGRAATRRRPSPRRRLPITASSPARRPSSAIRAPRISPRSRRPRSFRSSSARSSTWSARSRARTARSARPWT